MSPALISGSAEDGCLDSGAGEGEWNNAEWRGATYVGDVGTYKVCEWRQPAAPRCQPMAPCCQLAGPVLHIERPTERHGPPGASQSFTFTLQRASSHV